MCLSPFLPFNSFTSSLLHIFWHSYIFFTPAKEVIATFSHSIHTFVLLTLIDSLIFLIYAVDIKALAMLEAVLSHVQDTGVAIKL